MLTVEEVRSAGDLVRHLDEWRDLVERSDEALLFQTPAWVTTWLDAFWRERPLAFLMVRDAGRLVGLAPLLEDEEGEFSHAGAIVLPGDGEYAVRSDVLCSDDEGAVLDAVLGHILETRGSVRLALQHLPETSALLRALPAAAARHGLAAFRSEAWRSPRVRLDGGWPAYLRSRSSHLRTEIARKGRRLAAAGAVALVAVSEASQVEAALEDMRHIDGRSWKSARGGSLSSRPEEAGFLETLARRAAHEGWLRMYFLTLDGNPVAYVYGFVFRNEYDALHTGFDDAHRALSPGHVLFARVFRDCGERGLDAFDFLGGQERWKAQVANEWRTHADVCILSRDEIVCRMREEYRSRIKPFVDTRMPALSRVGRRLARLASHWTGPIG